MNRDIGVRTYRHVERPRHHGTTSGAIFDSAANDGAAVAAVSAIVLAVRAVMSWSFDIAVGAHADITVHVPIPHDRPTRLAWPCHDPCTDRASFRVATGACRCVGAGGFESVRVDSAC